MEQQVLTGLLSRGVPKHIAQGMVANMIAESGLNPGINEIKPLVPGSRGGYGLNQWTGPRRRAFEAFAQARGKAFDDLDTQLDFTLYELQGPEAKAWSAIQSAQDPIEAARLYSERFLRPGIPNMNKRLSEAARIAGLPAPQGGQTVQRSTMNAPPGLLGGSEPKPTFWDKIPGGLLSDPDRRARLAMAFEGMTLNPNQALIGALADEVKDRRQTKAQEKAMNATVEWLKSQGRDDLAAAVSSGALTGSQAAQMAYQRPDPMEALNVERAQLEIEALRNPQPDMTSAQREYQMAQQQGFQGSFLDYQNALAAARRPETNITTNVDAGAGGKFEEAFAKGDADTINTVYTAGLQAQRNLGRIDQLDALLKAAPTGAIGSIKLAAGEFGINTEGLSDIQSAQALINSLVPEQRQPGSGPMSDADLALFKQSLPRIINQPGGNETIIQTMRAIAQYDAQGAQIVQKLREGQITRAQAFEALQARKNPLDNFRAATGASPTASAPRGPQPGEIDSGYRFKGGDPADPNSWEPAQ